MYNEWSLNAFYSGTDDPALEKDMAHLAELIQKFKGSVAELSDKDIRASLRRTVEIEEEMSVLARKLSSYFHLRRSAHSPDAQGAKYSTKLQNMMASKTKESVRFRKFIGAIEDLDSVIRGDEILEAYRFLFSQIKKQVSHKLSDEAEVVFARMNLSGGKAWGDLFAYVTANACVDYKGKRLSLAAVRGLAESDDAEERRSAYEAELASYHPIRDALAFALNSIKTQVNTEAELRGYENPLTMTLEQSRMKKETLDAMFSAMREAFPKFREYLRCKANLLGYKNGLPWYEILAPMGKADGKTYTPEEAHAYLVGCHL